MQVAYASSMANDRAYRDNRRYWLGRWVEESGGPKAFSASVGIVDTHVTAMVKGRRNVGDELAERIERKLGRAPGDMDRDPPEDAGENVTISSSTVVMEPVPGYRVRRVADTVIPQYPTGGSMGTGVLLRDQPGEITSWRVTPEWIQKNVHNVTSPKNLAIVTGFGDSMKPMYNPGDPLLVDTGVKGVDFDGVYFFRIGTEGFIKRLQRVPGEGLVAISENKSYKDWTIRDGMDFEVFARVVKVWRGDDY
jgi:hypothetical protein